MKRVSLQLPLFALPAILALIAGASYGEALAPEEIKDPALRALQTKYLMQLNAAADEIAAHGYPSKFVLSRTLDVSGKALDATDHRAVEFSTFDRQTVLLVMGNSTAAFPPDISRNDRVSRTYLDVAVPIVKAIAGRLSGAPEWDALVIELTHHVRRNAGLTIDRFENSVFVLPRAAAQSIAEAQGPSEQLAQLAHATVYIDAKVVPFSGASAIPPELSGGVIRQPAPAAPAASAASPNASPTVSAPAAPSKPAPSAEALSRRQNDLQSVLDRMMNELASSAQFDPSTKSSLTAFRGGTYLRIPVITTLADAGPSSQYRLAALAFDRHVSHLVRLVLPYFKGDPGFDGITFRTSVKAGSAGSDTVEFYFPLADLRHFENYDITGQQLINAGIVLINGERAGLDLQNAEAVKP